MAGVISQSALLHRQLEEGFWTVSAVTAGDAVGPDSTVSSAIDYCGVKTVPNTGDIAVMGVALETLSGATTTTQVRCAVHGFCLKAKVNAAVVAGDPLVSDTTAGQLVKNVNTNISHVFVHALTASGTLADGTTAAGFASIWIY
jgi:hypothetical protein